MAIRRRPADPQGVEQPARDHILGLIAAWCAGGAGGGRSKTQAESAPSNSEANPATYYWSGRQDLNLRPPGDPAGPLDGTRDSPCEAGFVPTVSPRFRAKLVLPERLLSVREAAERLNISRASLYKLCAPKPGGPCPGRERDPLFSRRPRVVRTRRTQNARFEVKPEIELMHGMFTSGVPCIACGHRRAAPALDDAAGMAFAFWKPVSLE